MRLISATYNSIVSPIWLKYFRFGPAEWLWRSLTYWRIQPMRLSPAEGVAGARDATSQGPRSSMSARH